MILALVDSSLCVLRISSFEFLEVVSIIILVFLLVEELSSLIDFKPPHKIILKSFYEFPSYENKKKEDYKTYMQR